MALIKKIWLFSLWLLCMFQVSFANGIAVPGKTASQLYEVLNQEESEIIDPMQDQKDVWRKGAQDAIRAEDGSYKIDRLINSEAEIVTQAEANVRVLQTIWRLVNRALSFVSIIAFAILIFAGVKMVTGAGDEKAQWEWKAALMKIVRAIIGIALSWAIISFIFWTVSFIVK